MYANSRLNIQLPGGGNHYKNIKKKLFFKTFKRTQWVVKKSK